MAISAELIKALMSGEVGINDPYNQNPFFRQDEINQVALDKALEEDLLRKKQLAMTGLFSGDSGDSSVPAIDPAVMAALEAENSSARGERNKAFMDYMMKNDTDRSLGFALGLTDSMGGVTPSRVAQMANIYGRTPSIVQGLLSSDYANAAGFMGQNDSIFGGYTSGGFAPMGAQQSAALAAQDLGLFDNPEERAAWYAEADRGTSRDSGTNDSGGGWTSGGSVTDSGTGDDPDEGGYWG